MIDVGAVAGLVDSALGLYGTLILVYVILSWFQSGGSAVREVYRALEIVCEPYVGLFRRFLPLVALGGGALDLSPLVALLVLQLIRVAFATILRNLL